MYECLRAADLFGYLRGRCSRIALLKKELLRHLTNPQFHIVIFTFVHLVCKDSAFFGHIKTLLASLAAIMIKLLPLVNRADQDVKPFKSGILIFVVGKQQQVLATCYLRRCFQSFQLPLARFL